MDYFDDKGRKLDASECKTPVRGLVLRASQVNVMERVVVNGKATVVAKTVTQYALVYDKDGRVITVRSPVALVQAFSAR